MTAGLEPAFKNLEARVGFEPTNDGFADHSLRPLGYRASVYIMPKICQLCPTHPSFRRLPSRTHGYLMVRREKRGCDSTLPRGRLGTAANRNYNKTRESSRTPFPRCLGRKCLLFLGCCGDLRFPQEPR